VGRGVHGPDAVSLLLVRARGAPVTFRYVKPHATLEEVEAWCVSVGLTPCRLERGPDGLFRGTCTPDEEYTHAGAAPAATRE